MRADTNGVVSRLTYRVEELEMIDEKETATNRTARHQ